MEAMSIKVVSVGPAFDGRGAEALVVVWSRRQCEGLPEARLLVRLRLPEGATRTDAYDLVLQYLDPE